MTPGSDGGGVLPAAAAPQAPPDTHYLFAAGDLRFAVPLSAVRSVHRVEQWTPVPRAPRYLLGVTQARNGLFALVDLSGLKKNEAVPPAPPLYAVVVEASGLRAGLVSAELGRTVAEPGIFPWPAAAGTPEAELQGSRGWMALDDGPAVVLDPLRLLRGLAPRFGPGAEEAA